MYVFFVHINKIDPKTFWESDIAFLENITDNITAFENYLNNPKEY
nr:MAG TPA: hypothetical protein [Caudoviricetes sp.]DAV74637.1 MAG TPA: hypothetical protein [Caudoviricetes sp.]